MSNPEAICDHVRCNRQAVISVTYEGRVVHLCKSHFNELQRALRSLALKYGSSSIEQVLVKTRAGKIRIETRRRDCKDKRR